MSDHYRSHQPTSKLQLEPNELLAAYLATRLPATYAVAAKVLSELHLDPAPASLLDLGAGVGAAALAAAEIFPGIATTLIEANPTFRTQAQQLLPAATIVSGNASSVALAPHDLTIANYLFNELSSGARRQLLEAAWSATRQALILIEPGSTSGFAIVKEARTWLLAHGGHMIAPCPHADACPLPKSDWCHFAVRLQRSSLHRRIKQGQLPYEDEKFSYIVIGRSPATTVPARVIRRPSHHPGMIEIKLCAPGGIEDRKVTKRDKDAFRAARKAEWGDQWPRPTGVVSSSPEEIDTEE